MPPLTAKNLPKIGKKKEKIRKKEEKSGRKGKNREGSFTLHLLTDRAGYATVEHESDDRAGDTVPSVCVTNENDMALSANLINICHHIVVQ